MANHYSAEVIYWITGITLAIRSHMAADTHSHTCGELETFGNAGEVAELVENELSSRFDFDDFDGVWPYEIHDDLTAINALYDSLALVCMELIDRELIPQLVNTFLAARDDLKPRAPEMPRPRNPVADGIKANVFIAMQDAEEIWGDMPVDDYLRLMEEISAEALARHASAAGATPRRQPAAD